MTRVLVAVAAYPTIEGKKTLYYVHSRNLYYTKNGIEVDVLNFSAKENYVIDDIPVYTKDEIIKRAIKYDLLICHAANIRNHFKFLKEYGEQFEKILFVFHGHEVLHINKYYPRPYPYMKKDILKRLIIQNKYDDYKIKMWKNYFLNNISKLHFIFVSNWFYQQFLIEMQFTKGELENIEKRVKIINNSVGSFFENNHYSNTNIKYDFITIRNYMDDSQYAVDIVWNLTRKLPNFKFCIIGKGNFFDHHAMSENITWIDKELSHEEMKSYINSSKIALLPTREDTQGLMACELATYGIPLITSNISICKEIFSDCPHAVLIDNDKPDIAAAIKTLNTNTNENRKIWDRYFAKNTIFKEINFIKQLTK